jgi:DNA-binding response OmpR family regulator
VRRLRAKLGGRGPQLHTVRGVGYRLDHLDRAAVVREQALTA